MNTPASTGPRAIGDLTLACVASAPLLGCALAAAAEPHRGWPAEPEAQATNLTGVEPGFRDDLSGAVWNPLTRTLWVCRNGPGDDSRLWALQEDGGGQWSVSEREGRRAEWRELGDSEGVAFADFAASLVYVLVEGAEQIHVLDVSTYGETDVVLRYDTSPFLPRDGSAGAEGLTFVPDEHLERGGFVDSHGEPRTSRGGLGGLMLVGHQNGGGLYAFDLAPDTGAVELVGEYRVPCDGAGGEPLTRVVALEFDRSSGELFIWHGLEDANVLSVARLSSEQRPAESFRRLDRVDLYEGPGERQYEGLALTPLTDCTGGVRSLFLTVDDGDDVSLLRYEHLTLGCRNAPEPAGASSEPAPGEPGAGGR